MDNKDFDTLMKSIESGEIPQRRFLKAKEAQNYFHMCRNTLDKVAKECDALKKIGDRLNLYDIEKINRYIATM